MSGYFVGTTSGGGGSGNVETVNHVSPDTNKNVQLDFVFDSVEELENFFNQGLCKEGHTYFVTEEINPIFIAYLEQELTYLGERLTWQ